MRQAFQLSNWEKRAATTRARENQRSRQNERIHNEKKKQAAQQAKQAAEGFRMPCVFHSGDGKTYDEVLMVAVCTGCSSVSVWAC